MDKESYREDATRRGVPTIVQDAMIGLDDKLSKPPVPVMSQEEYEKLDPVRKAILVCNVPKCGDVVCTHGAVCVKHRLEALPASKPA